MQEHFAGDEAMAFAIFRGGVDHPIRTVAGAILATAAVCTATLAQVAPLPWPEAIARFAAERTRAAFCVDQARALGVPALDPLAATYTEAKAEVDGVIAGLSVALAEGRGRPEDLPDLERRMSAGFEGRRRFCEQVAARLPPRSTGERAGLGDALGGAVGPVMEAVTEIWKRLDDADRLRRETIRAQLEATRWPAFDKSASPSR
jgi:hypothetical protein